MATEADRFARWFSTADLPANRSGHLARDQARRLGLEAAVGRGVELLVGAGLIVIALVVAALGLTGDTTVAPGGTGPTLVAAAIVGLIGLLFLWVGRRGRFSQQVAAGTVEHITGPALLSEQSRSSGESSYYVHELRVGQLGLQFEIDGHLYRAITQGETLTAYYLAGARRLVNLESGGGAAGGAMTGSAAAAAVVAGPPDGTPLPQAVIGRWRGADTGTGLAMVVDFRADGTLTMGMDLSAASALEALPGPLRAMAQHLDQPRTMRYHWADADHLQVEGQPGTAQVRLSGGQLIVDLAEGQQHLTRLPDQPAEPPSPAAQAPTETPA